MATKSKKPAGRRAPGARTATKKAASKRAPARRATTGRRAAPARRGAAAQPRERKGVMELGGKPATLVGDEVKVGQRAPHFTVQVGFWPGLDLWKEIDPLDVTAGQVRILAAVPSLDTSTCDAETRTFNQRAADLGPGISVITLSTDLPVAQKRWCGAASIDRVFAASDHMAVEFGLKYGLLMKERRWLRRAVFVVGPDDVIRYAAYMPRLSEQPNYDEVLAAAQKLLPAASAERGK